MTEQKSLQSRVERLEQAVADLTRIIDKIADVLLKMNGENPEEFNRKWRSKHSKNTTEK